MRKQIKRPERVYDTHKYFIEASMIWEEFLSKSLTMSKRNQALDTLREKYLKPDWRS